MHHDSSAGSQNQGNSLGTRPIIRQSKYFRQHESGNATKQLLGMSHLAWDVNQCEGAFKGHRTHDDNDRMNDYGQGGASTAQQKKNADKKREEEERERMLAEQREVRDQRALVKIKEAQLRTLKLERQDLEAELLQKRGEEPPVTTTTPIKHPLQQKQAQLDGNRRQPPPPSITSPSLSSIVAHRSPQIPAVTYSSPNKRRNGAATTVVGGGQGGPNNWKTSSSAYGSWK
jgi:hypothetical protein